MDANGGCLAQDEVSKRAARVDTEKCRGHNGALVNSSIDAHRIPGTVCYAIEEPQILVRIVMPELPEVETTSKGIEPHLLGQKIRLVLVRQDQLRWPISADLGQAVTGQRIDAVERRGKYLFLV